jgi:predicted transcriptional regulator
MRTIEQRNGIWRLAPDQIVPFVAKMRIAKGVSQTELARRLGVSKQVVSRYEETEYQTVRYPDCRRFSAQSASRRLSR